MKAGLKIAAVFLIALTSSGCLGTVAVVGSTLAAARDAGCHVAGTDRTANQSVVRDICGSWFD